MASAPKAETTQTHWCYRCGHSREDHRQMIRVATRENIWVDCLRPVGTKTSVLKIKVFHVCQCAEYLDKENVKEVNLPNE